MATKSKAASAVEKHDGWRLELEREPQSVETRQGHVRFIPGEYRAVARIGLTVREITAETPEQLEERISEYERIQPSTQATPGPTEEQLKESAKATLASLVTAGARPSVDVNLTPAQDSPKPKAVNLSVPPQIEETRLDADDAALVAQLGVSTEGLGTGTQPA